jgi:RsiW-degrading membrane proteinase PrsW (M82 family)
MSIVIRVVLGGQAGPARDFDKDVVRIGRDPAGDVVLDGDAAAGVSRNHAEIRRAGAAWRIADLNSSNGTFLRGRRIQEAVLQDGDELQLAPQGPVLRVSLPTTMAGSGAGATQVAASSPLPGAFTVAAPPPVAPVAPPAGTPTDSELLPLRMGTGALASRGYLIPGLVTAGSITAFLLLLQAGNVRNSIAVLLLFFVLASTFVLYRLCGKEKPVIVLGACALAVGMFVHAAHPLVMAPIKGTVLPLIGKPVQGSRPGTVRLEEPDSVPAKFIYHFFMAALPEELEKAAPALIGLWLVVRAHRKANPGQFESAMEVREPLDGILLGIAGAAGFHLLEAFEYAAEPIAKIEFLMANANRLGQTSPARLLQIGFDAGLSSMFQATFRGISGAFGHLAYSGIFGYYIGLAALRPEHRRALLIRGFLTAALTHAAWNSTSDVGGAIVIPPLAFALLVTSIIKARALSPARAQNFATTLERR